jgi:hypothetical protein
LMVSCETQEAQRSSKEARGLSRTRGGTRITGKCWHWHVNGLHTGCAQTRTSGASAPLAATPPGGGSCHMAGAHAH